MRFLLVMIPFVVWGMDFEFGIERIYPLKSYMTNGVINHESKDFEAMLLQILQTQVSRIVVDKQLKYYYHTHKLDDDWGKLEGEDLENNAKWDNAKYCFIITRNTRLQTLQVKSNAMLLDWNDIASLGESHTCQSKNYIAKTYIVCHDRKYVY